MTLRIISGIYKGRSLKTPKSLTTRPTQSVLREAVFNICQNEIQGARFLDLFAGSGAMGLEALSRGASHVTFVEQNRNALACIRDNIAHLEASSLSSLIPYNAERAIAILTKQGALFDIIYVDPPYDLFFPIESLAVLLAPHALLFVEERAHSKKTPIDLPSLQIRNSRRFAAAQLITYVHK